MLTAFVLLALLPLPPALLACGAVGTVAPQAGQVGMLALSGLGAVLAAFFLVGGTVGGVIQLPVGLPASGMSFGLDALSGFFLLPVLLAGAAVALSGLGRGGRDAALLPVLLAGLVLALLAADGFALLVGLGVAALGGWGLLLPVAGADGDRTGLRQLGIFAFGAACLVGALGLLAPLAGGVPDLRFVATHPEVAEGARGGAVLVLALLGTGALIGLAPFQAWLPAAAGRAGGAGAALLGAAGPVVALYLLVRLLFELSGPLLPGWWGWPLLALGAVSMATGGLRANLAVELRPLVVAAGLIHGGLAVIGIGIALIARAADLPPLAGLALGAALLQAFTLTVFQTLLLLCAASVEAGAGTRRLDRLGGLLQSMRVTSVCALVGAVAVAALPPAAGFAGAWLVFQAVFAALRVGGLALQLLLTATAAAMALGLGLGVAAMVRLIGIAFLGRPRSPRGAAAEEAPRPARLATGLLAAALLLLGLLPGPALGLAAPALHALLGLDPDGRNSVLGLVPQAGQPPYSAPAVTGLLVLATLLIVWAGRRWTVAGERRAPAWEGGFAAPPPWLPFGDPATQLGPVSFSATLARLLAPVLLASRPALPRAMRPWLLRQVARISASGDAATAGRLALGLLAALLLLVWALRA